MSKIASSPTKNGEYLACGLPVIINAGIGDSDALVTEWEAGVLLDEVDEAHFEKAFDSIESLMETPDVKTRVRHVAEKLFDLETIGAERYTQLYESVLGD
jgi:glycosyltransferase involved in cell wall biosynthesis